MSAFIVSNLHISALVDAAADGMRSHDTGLSYYWDGRTHYIRANVEDRERAFRLLLSENYKSVNARYRQKDEPSETDRYEFTRFNRRFSAVEILKAINCYEYQSCEHEGWEESEAHAIMQALRKKMIAALDGYEEAAWEIAA